MVFALSGQTEQRERGVNLLKGPNGGIENWKKTISGILAMPLPHMHCDGVRTIRRYRAKRRGSGPPTSQPHMHCRWYLYYQAKQSNEEGKGTKGQRFDLGCLRFPHSPHWRWCLHYQANQSREEGNVKKGYLSESSGNSKLGTFK